MIRVKKLPKDPGPTAWNAVLPPPAAPRILQDAITADWLVIGAGFAGLAAARRLAELRRGERIAVLEASRVGDGPAGRNSGFMVDLPHDLASSDYSGDFDADRRQITQNRAAIDFAAAAARDYDLPQEAFDLCGKTNAAATEQGAAHNRDFAAHLAHMGEPSDLLDAAHMREMTGSDYYLSGLYTPGAAMLQPAMFIRGFAAGMADQVDLFESSPVISLARTGPDWRAETPSGSVNAPKVILAVNGHVESFGFFKRRLMHVFTYASMTRALTADEITRLGGRPRWGATPSDPMGTSVRRISGVGGDRILIRNRFTYDPSMRVSDRRLRQVARDHDRAFRARFPMLDGVSIEHRWGGRLCLSRNGVAAFGEVEPGLFSACCQNGLGTNKGVFAGMCAADLAAGGNNPLVADLLEAPAPRRLPPEPFAWLGANAYLRWIERRAGREM